MSGGPHESGDRHFCFSPRLNFLLTARSPASLPLKPGLRLDRPPAWVEASAMALFHLLPALTHQDADDRIARRHPACRSGARCHRHHHGGELARTLRRIEIRLAGLEGGSPSWPSETASPEAAAPCPSLRPRQPRRPRRKPRRRPPSEPEAHRHPSSPAAARAEEDQPGGALRHAMGGLGRRHRARARRLLPGALFDRAGLVRARARACCSPASWRWP